MDGGEVTSAECARREVDEKGVDRSRPGLQRGGHRRALPPSPVAVPGHAGRRSVLRRSAGKHRQTRLPRTPPTAARDPPPSRSHERHPRCRRLSAPKTQRLRPQTPRCFPSPPRPDPGNSRPRPPVHPRLPQGPRLLRCLPRQLQAHRPRFRTRGEEGPPVPLDKRCALDTHTLSTSGLPSHTLPPQASSPLRYGTARDLSSPECSRYPTSSISSSTTTTPPPTTTPPQT